MSKAQLSSGLFRIRPLASAALFAACAALAVSLPLCALANPQPAAPAAPQAVTLSPSGARLEVVQQLPVEKVDGASLIRICLPADAEQFQVTVDGLSVARWTSVPHMLDRGGLARRRFERQAELDRVEADLAAVDAALNLLGTAAESLPEGPVPAQNLSERQKYLTEQVPALRLKKDALKDAQARLQSELREMPEGESRPGRLMLVTLAQNAPEKPVTARYAYTLKDCGWSPSYVLDATVVKDRKDTVSVRLVANLWQNSGMDWTGAKLTLVSGAAGPREPGRLPSWVIEGEKPKPASRSAYNSAGKGDAMVLEDAEAPMMMKDSRAQAAPRQSRVDADMSGLYASWSPAVSGLEEGRSSLVIAEDTWDAPLQWLARPGLGNGRVWLMARCTVPASTAWPKAQADFLINGQKVGSGRFAPVGSEAELFFGPDPRVDIRGTEDTRKREEKGIFGNGREWKWAWTYTVINNRDRAVTVRLERPAPRAVDAEVKIKYENSPEAKEDLREHKLVWTVEVPAGGKTDVKHGVVVTSPKDIPMPKAP